MSLWRQPNNKERDAISFVVWCRASRALPTCEDAMAPSSLLPGLRIALLVATVLTPELSLAQSPRVSPLPDAPPEIMSKEARDPKDCTKSGLNVGQDNVGQDKSQSAVANDKSFSEQLALSDGVICPPPGIDPDIRVSSPEDR
jgi:hypothetical protein